MKFFARLVKYSKQTLRKEVIKFSLHEFANAPNFYKRRLYLVFIDEMIQIFSVNFIKEEGIIEAVLHLLALSKTNYYFYPKIIDYLKYFIPYIQSDIYLMEIVKKRLEIVKKSVKSKEINDFEIIKVSYLNRYFLIILVLEEV